MPRRRSKRSRTSRKRSRKKSKLIEILSRIPPEILKKCLDKIRMSEKPLKSRQVKLFFDGGSRSNPGPAGCGWHIESLTEGFSEINGYLYLGHATNNEAEYQALINGLKCLISNGQTLDVEVYGDSKLVIEQMKGNWKVKAQGLIPLWKEAQNLKKQFSRIEFHWIRRELNSKADALANQAIDNS